MGNLCQTPQHEDEARFNAETHMLRAAKVALSIASDYEDWGYLRRSIKWYQTFQRCMALYVFQQFEGDLKRRLKPGTVDPEELDAQRRDDLINHVQEARNMYKYCCGLMEQYRKDTEQDPPALACPLALPNPRWAMWMELIKGDDMDDDELESTLERMGLLKKQSRKTKENIRHKQEKDKAAAAGGAAGARQSTRVNFKPNITINPSINPNMSGASAKPTAAQSGSGSVHAGAASATGGDVPMMQPIQTPSGLLYPMMTPQGLMYVPMAGSSYGAPPPATGMSQSEAGFAYNPSAPPLAPRTPAPYAHAWV